MLYNGLIFLKSFILGRSFIGIGVPLPLVLLSSLSVGVFHALSEVHLAAIEVCPNNAGAYLLSHRETALYCRYRNTLLFLPMDILIPAAFLLYLPWVQSPWVERGKGEARLSKVQ